MDLDALVTERLAYSLGKLNLAATYRELLLSVVAKYLRAQLGHYTTCKPLVFLPQLCCEACEADPRRSVGVTTAWFLLQVSAHLLDTVEDQEYEMTNFDRNEQGVFVNLSTGMILVAEWILNHLELDRVDAGAAWDIQRAFQETVLSVCSGQHLDLSVPSPDLPTCWQIAEAKSGAAFGLACYAGARLATNQSEWLCHLEKFGKYLGTIIQISDDLEDLGGDPKDHQGIHGDSPLIHAYLNYVGVKFSESPDCTIPLPGGISLQNHLFYNGSILYLSLETMKYAEMARKELSSLRLASEPYQELLAIVRHLSRLGASPN